MPETPRATYRLQLSSAFTLDDAARVLPYLAELGISHVYLSPITTARPGSTHGYDVVDHNHVNPELGGEAAWRRFTAAAKASGLKVLVDIVPNHVGVGGAGNAWWLDVLEWGPDSPWASHFDIQWFWERAGLAGQLLVPLLGRQYGEALEGGDLALRFDAEEGSLSVWAYGVHRLPLRPADYGQVLGATLPTLRELFRAQRDGGTEARGSAATLKRELARQAQDPGVARRIADRITRLNGTAGDPDSFDALDRLIARQHWRIASHRVAAEDINYRRFFNINDLAGVRVEDPAVFEELHRMILDRVAAGEVHGLRIDHIDGLKDPAGYCERLRERCGEDCYVVVEKILAAHETLPAWPVQGTTGYDFAATATAVFVDERAEPQFTRLWHELGGADDFDTLVAECKRLVMRRELAAELAVLARMASRIAHEHRRSRDFTIAALSETLREIVAWFPVYRSYVGVSGASSDDRHHIAWAVGRARRVLPEFDDTLFDFLSGLMTGEVEGRVDAAAGAFAGKLQQYTGPVMAKGLEDTAFYRYVRLVACNEVGSRPSTFGISVQAFHQDMQRRASEARASLLAGTTHDTKRGEDARARLAALTGFADEWASQVQAARRLVRARRGVVTDEAPPDAVDEYYFLQSLLGAWPTEFEAALPDAQHEGWRSFGERIEAAMLKAVREAKRHTSWARPDEEYEAAVKAWLAAALDLSRPNAFLESFRPFVARVAECGRRVALAQLMLRLTVPGVPDVYQGSEFWELSLVDPDNRRPVDFESRRLSFQRGEHPKQMLLSALLRFRSRQPALFAEGSYAPLALEGSAADCGLAFERRLDSSRLVVVVTTRPAELERRGGWGDTRLSGLDPPGGPWRELAGIGSWDLLPGLTDGLGSSPVAAFVSAS